MWSLRDMLHRPAWWTGIGIVVLSVSLLAATEEVGRDAPNVVLISVDTLRADHLPCYGYHRNTAPNICTLAKHSTLFENTITQAPWTLPSHTTLLTSQYPEDVGITGISSSYVQNYSLPAHTTTLAEALQAGGYRTAAFVGSVAGWDGFFGGHLRPRFGFDQGFDRYHAEGIGFNHTVPAAIDWLSANRDRRFFLFLHGYEPHSPYDDQPSTYTRMFASAYTGPLTRYRLGFRGNTTHPGILGNITWKDGYILTTNNTTRSLQQDDIEYIRAAYDGGIRYTDTMIGIFLDALTRLGLRNDTVIIIVGDHGEMLGEVKPAHHSALFGHSTPFEEIIRVPLIIHRPQQEPERITAQAGLIDVMPTILDIAGMMNKTLAQRMQGDRLPLTPEEVAPAFNRYVFVGAGTAYAIRTNTWKYIGKPLRDTDGQLYHLKADSDETRNVIDQYPDVAERLQERLQEWWLNRDRR